MRDSKGHDRHDELLTAALPSYTGAEAPDAGLTQRILARVAAEGAATRFEPVRKRWPVWAIWTGWKTWAVAVPAAACLLLAIALTIRPHGKDPARSNVAGVPEISPERRVERAPEQREKTRRAKATSPQVARSHRPILVSDVSAQQAALPKLDVFPTPLPPSSDERKLAAYAVAAPEPERVFLTAKTDAPDTNMSIAFIEIPPVTVADALSEPPDRISHKSTGHRPMD
jgi:hypothetical protein